MTAQNSLLPNLEILDSSDTNMGGGAHHGTRLPSESSRWKVPFGMAVNILPLLQYSIMIHVSTSAGRGESSSSPSVVPLRYVAPQVGCFPEFRLRGQYKLVGTRAIMCIL